MSEPVVGPEADARRARLLARIAQHNGAPIESLTKPQAAATGAPEPAVHVPHVATYEGKVLSRLTAIAVFTGILAGATVISVIANLVAAASIAGR